MERAYRGYLVHKALWAVPAIFTLVWLTLPACQLKRILKRKVEDTKGFRRDIRKIHGINIAFIIGLLYQIAFSILFILNFDKAASEK